MKLLVTGASGLLGAHIMLNKDLARHTVLGLYGQHACAFPGANTDCIDLFNEQALTALVDSYQPDWIIHCAAFTNVSFCEKYPEQAKRLHIDTTEQLAVAASNCNAKFLYVSTDSVFDGECGGYTEHDVPNPLNAYASTKLAGEAVAMQYCLDTLVVRTNLYGWNMQNKQSLSEWVIAQLHDEQVISGFSDVYFNPLHVYTLAQLLYQLIERNARGVYHLGSRNYCSKYGFVQQIARLFNLNEAFIQSSSVDIVHSDVKRPKKTWLCSSKVRDVFPDMQLPSIEEGILEFKTLFDNGFVERLKSYAC